MSAGRHLASQGENKFIITRLPHLGNILRFIVIVTRFSPSLSPLRVFFMQNDKIVNADTRTLLIHIVCVYTYFPFYFVYLFCSAAIKDAAVFILFSPLFHTFRFWTTYRNALHCVY